MAGKRRALLIATDTYSDPTFCQLRAPRADADVLAAVLADPAIGGYEIDSLHNPAAHETNLAIEDLFAAARLDDLVLLYLSGHGVKDDFGQLHLVMTNSRHDRLNATAVSAQFVRNQMSNTRSRCIVVVLDCCFAGAFPPGSAHRAGESADVLAQLGGRGSAVMTSSSALEYSFEPGEAASSTVFGSARPSVFTGALVQGLRTGAADRNGDGLIDVDELYEFIYEEVEAAGKPQTPGLDSRFQGRLIVANSPTANELPAEVALAMRSTLPSVRRAIVGELSALLRSAKTTTAEAARSALGKLAQDENSDVAAAARAVLAPAPEKAVMPTISPGTAVVPDQAAQQNTRPSPPRPGDAPQVPTPEPPRMGVRRKVFIATAISAAAAVMAAAMTFLPDLTSAGRDSTAQQQTQQPTQPEQIPAGFVPPPVRPSPLPDTVYCQYPPDGKTSRIPVKPPASGPVSTKGTVRATVNTNVGGAIPLLLDRSLAPCTVNSFISLAKQGAFNGVRCAGGRVEWISCGQRSSPGYTLATESFPGLRYQRGYLVMDDLAFFGTTFAMHFGDSQLVPEYTVFGTISEEGLKFIDSLIPPGYDGQSDQLDSVIFTSVDIQD